MTGTIRTPNRFGHEMRARKRNDPAAAYKSECITRPMTKEERAWLDSLPKPDKKGISIGANLWSAKES